MIRSKPPKQKPKRTLPVGFVMNLGSKPVKWDKTMIFRALFLANLGLTEKEIAIAVDVHEHTIYYWKRTKPAFFDALQKENKNTLIE